MEQPYARNINLSLLDKLFTRMTEQRFTTERRDLTKDNAVDPIFSESEEQPHVKEVNAGRIRSWHAFGDIPPHVSRDSNNHDLPFGFASPRQRAPVRMV